MNRLMEWYQAEPPPGEEDARRFWRERILSAVLIGATVLGSAAYLINLIQVIGAGQWGWVLVYTLAFGWAVIVTIFRDINYQLRSASFPVKL